MLFRALITVAADTVGTKSHLPCYRADNFTASLTLLAFIFTLYLRRISLCFICLFFINQFHHCKCCCCTESMHCHKLPVNFSQFDVLLACRDGNKHLSFWGIIKVNLAIIFYRKSQLFQFFACHNKALLFRALTCRETESLIAADKRVHKTRPIPRASFKLSASISVPSLSIGLAVYSVVLSRA